MLAKKHARKIRKRICKKRTDKGKIQKEDAVGLTAQKHNGSKAENDIDHHQGGRSKIGEFQSSLEKQPRAKHEQEIKEADGKARYQERAQGHIYSRNVKKENGSSARKQRRENERGDQNAFVATDPNATKHLIGTEHGEKNCRDRERERVREYENRQRYAE
jgi:hypothetical protein